MTIPSLLQPQDKGRYILEYVCKQLNILEMDYFGLRYVDKERERVSVRLKNIEFLKKTRLPRTPYFRFLACLVS